MDQLIRHLPLPAAPRRSGVSIDDTQVKPVPIAFGAPTPWLA
jgi:hypothetical protein